MSFMQDIVETTSEILLVEDALIQGHVIKKMLEEFGFQVKLLKNGAEAFSYIQKHLPRMVLTDIVMPEMDGLTLCSKIREANFSKYIYVIMLTSKDKTEDYIAGLHAGANDYICKPFEPEELKARIRSGWYILQLEEQYKKAQTQILHSEKLASIGQLAAGIAHEINTPIQYVCDNTVYTGIIYRPA